MALAPRADEAPISTTRAVLGMAGLFAVVGVMIVILWFALAWLGVHHAGGGARMAALVVFGVAVLGAGWAWTRTRSAAASMAPSPASRRYRQRILIAMSLYFAALLLSVHFRAQLHPTGVAAYALALIVAAPVIGVVRALGLYLREETDEVERALQIECMLWAAGAVLVSATAWGYLEMIANAPHIQSWVALLIWALALEAARLTIRRRYR